MQFPKAWNIASLNPSAGKRIKKPRSFDVEALFGAVTRGVETVANVKNLLARPPQIVGQQVAPATLTPPAPKSQTATYAFAAIGAVLIVGLAYIAVRR
jgi:hypothetical protein